jgi:hypothetical protein
VETRVEDRIGEEPCAPDIEMGMHPARRAHSRLASSGEEIKLSMFRLVYPAVFTLSHGASRVHRRG